MELSLRKTNDSRLVLKISGDLDLYNQSELREVFSKKIMQYRKDLILDMSSVEYLDSSGVGCIIFMYQQQKVMDRKLFLISLQSPVLKVIQLTRLDTVFQIYPSLSAIPASPTASPAGR